jgi:hypothetical protein
MLFCKCKYRALNLEGGLEILKYAINIEKASMIYTSKKKTYTSFYFNNID